MSRKRLIEEILERNRDLSLLELNNESHFTVERLREILLTYATPLKKKHQN